MQEEDFPILRLIWSIGYGALVVESQLLYRADECGWVDR
jgi:hypothetical protein